MRPLVRHPLVLLAGILLLGLLVGLSGCRPESNALAQPEVTRGVVATAVASAPGDPAAVAAAFYDWYLAYADPEAGRNPLVDRVYRESEHLSTAGVAAIDAKLAQMEAMYGGLMFDPILMAQALPQAISAEVWKVDGENASVIVHEQFGETVHDVTVDLVVEEGDWRIAQIRDGSPATADGATKLFFGNYIEQARAALDNDSPSLLHSGAYRDNPYLTAALIAQVDGLREGGDLAYDPFLLAQDIPEDILVEKPLIDGDSAVVRVGRRYSGTPQPSYISVHLVREGERWLIDSIQLEESTAGSETAGAATVEPATVVESFYAWWIASVESGIAGESENPLMTQGYHGSPYLTPTFIAEVDEIIAGFDRGGYDPFLCAQDVPTELFVDGTIYTSAGARVALHSSFGKQHALVVMLEPAGEDTWRIGDIVCPGTPQTNATIFYTWYLAYTRSCCVLEAADPAEMRNPLVDGAYHEAPFINPTFAAAVEAELAQMNAAGGIGHDPILQAQAFPPDFSVLPGAEEGTVVVDMAFANEHRLEVQMEEVNGQWLVSGVTRLEPLVQPTPAAAGPDMTDWVTVHDTVHGFSFQIPPDWVAQEQDLQGPGMPDDWPVLSQYLVMPASLAEALAARSGPPGGDEMVPVPPFAISFLEGDQAAFDRAFALAATSDAVTIDGKEYLVQQQAGEYTLPRYVLRDPAHLERWLVVEDVVNGFPGREEQAAAVFGILDGILMTLAFDG
jgi:hypothetical protein